MEQDNTITWADDSGRFHVIPHCSGALLAACFPARAACILSGEASPENDLERSLLPRRACKTDRRGAAPERNCRLGVDGEQPKSPATSGGKKTQL